MYEKVQKICKNSYFKSIWGCLYSFRRIGIAFDSFVLLFWKAATRSCDTKKGTDYLSAFSFSPHFPVAVEHLFPGLEEQEAKKRPCFQAFIYGTLLLPKDHSLKRHGYTPARKIRDPFSCRPIAKSLTNRRQFCSGTSFDNRTQ